MKIQCLIIGRDKGITLTGVAMDGQVAMFRYNGGVNIGRI